MEPLVSVIILPYEDDTYLVRCINSIKRQTYKNVEILVMGSEKTREEEGNSCKYIICENTNNWQDIDETMYKVNGNFIFFCDINMVLEPCLLEKIVVAADEKLVLVNNRVITGKDVVENKTALFSIAGKLYDKNIIVQNDIHIKENEFCPEYLFIAEYMNCCKMINNRKDVYLYGIEKQPYFNRDSNLNNQKIKEYIEKINNSMGTNSQKQLLIELFFEELQYCNKQDEEKQNNIINTATVVAEQCKDLPAVIYNISIKYLKEIFADCIEKNNETTWKKLKSFFNEINDVYLQRTILPVFGIDTIKQNLLLRYSLYEYKFYQDKILEEICNKEVYDSHFLKEIVKLREEIVKLREEIVKRESNEIMTKDEKEISKQIKKLKEEISEKNSNQVMTKIVHESVCLQGTELGHYFVNECVNGKMGIGFVLKSLIGCIKFKFRIKI